MNDLKITGIDVTLCETRVKGNFADSTRNVETIGFAVVDVSTDQGLHGIGVTYHEVGGEAIRDFIKYAIEPKMIGRSPFETEVLYEENFHYMRGVGRKGLAFCAYSAVDIALWDLKGKALGMPLFRLLGGTNPEVPIYASGGWTSYSTEELVAEAKMMVSKGYKKIKLKVGVEGGNNPDEDVRRVAAVREAIGRTLALCWMPTMYGARRLPSSLLIRFASTTLSSSRSRYLQTIFRDWQNLSVAPTFRWLPASMSIPVTACATCF